MKAGNSDHQNSYLELIRMGRSRIRNDAQPSQVKFVLVPELALVKHMAMNAIHRISSQHKSTVSLIRLIRYPPVGTGTGDPAGKLLVKHFLVVLNLESTDLLLLAFEDFETPG